MCSNSKSLRVRTPAIRIFGVFSGEFAQYSCVNSAELKGCITKAEKIYILHIRQKK